MCRGKHAKHETNQTRRPSPFLSLSPSPLRVSLRPCLSVPLCAPPSPPVCLSPSLPIPRPFGRIPSTASENLLPRSDQDLEPKDRPVLGEDRPPRPSMPSNPAFGGSGSGSWDRWVVYREGYPSSSARNPRNGPFVPRRWFRWMVEDPVSQFRFDPGFVLERKPNLLLDRKETESGSEPNRILWSGSIPEGIGDIHVFSFPSRPGKGNDREGGTWRCIHPCRSNGYESILTRIGPRAHLVPYRLPLLMSDPPRRYVCGYRASIASAPRSPTRLESVRKVDGTIVVCKVFSGKEEVSSGSWWWTFPSMTSRDGRVGSWIERTRTVVSRRRDSKGLPSLLLPPVSSSSRREFDVLNVIP